MSTELTGATEHTGGRESADMADLAGVAELLPGVHRLDLRFVNAYVVEDGDDLVLCDAGTPWSTFALEDRLAAIGYEPADVDRVLLTHWDVDHVGGLSKLDLHAPVYAGAFDAAILRGDAKPPLTNHKGLLQRAMGRYVDRPRLPIRDATDGDRIGSFRAYHTPGHTPGHVAWLSEELDVALLGDLVMGDAGGLTPSPRLISYDADEVQASIDSIAERAPAFEAACVGHGEPLATGGSGALPTTPPVEEDEEPEGTAAKLRAGAGRITGAAGRIAGATRRVGGAAGRLRGIGSRIR